MPRSSRCPDEPESKEKMPTTLKDVHKILSNILQDPAISERRAIAARRLEAHDIAMDSSGGRISSILHKKMLIQALAEAQAAEEKSIEECSRLNLHSMTSRVVFDAMCHLTKQPPGVIKMNLTINDVLIRTELLLNQQAIREESLLVRKPKRHTQIWLKSVIAIQETKAVLMSAPESRLKF